MLKRFVKRRYEIYPNLRETRVLDHFQGKLDQPITRARRQVCRNPLYEWHYPAELPYGLDGDEDGCPECGCSGGCSHEEEEEG